MTHTRQASSPAPDRAAIRTAARTAGNAARESGVVIREIHDIDGLADIGRLLDHVWKSDATNPKVNTELLKAFSASRNYVAGVFLDRRLIGAAVAFFGAVPDANLHSHITGLTDTNRARSIGYALKLHQRAWALAAGASTITWTFDPLVRRNAYFNIAKLGGAAVEYLPNFYGGMNDLINAGDQSDRLLLKWRLLDPAVVSVCDHRRPPEPGSDAPVADSALRIGADAAPVPGPWDGSRSVVAIPPDIEDIRRKTPRLALRWRMAVRDVLGGAMNDGAAIVGFRRTQGYVIEKNREQP